MVTPTRQQLRELVDSMPDSAVPTAFAALSSLAEAVPTAHLEWPPSWFGAINRADGPVRERADLWLADGFGEA
jgi:hypothetical protein